MTKTKKNSQSGLCYPSSPSATGTTSSGRAVRSPARYDDTPSRDSRSATSAPGRPAAMNNHQGARASHGGSGRSSGSGSNSGRGSGSGSGRGSGSGSGNGTQDRAGSSCASADRPSSRDCVVGSSQGASRGDGRRPKRRKLDQQSVSGALVEYAGFLENEVKKFTR